MVRLLSLALVYCIAGCASSPYKVNYYVSPPGGVLYVETANGTRPFHRYNSVTGEARGYYGSENPDKYTDEAGCYHIAKVFAAWVSGKTVAQRVHGYALVDASIGDCSMTDPV